MSFSDVLAATGIGQAPVPSQGQIGFGQLAQDNNRYPGDFGANGANALAARAFDLSKDPFWDTQAIDATRWNKRYPYQLLVLEVAPDGQSYYPADGGLWEFTLPIPPEAASISMPFASTVQATLGGIVEEHNGAPFRTINIQATTGVMPNRGTAASGTGVPDAQRFTAGVFGGAIQQFTQIASTVAAQLGFSQYNLENDTELNVGLPGFLGRGTGYYQFRLLQAFLEGYAALKKRPEGRTKRLAFCIWKDQAVYLCTPQLFEVRRTKDDPLAYPFTLTLKAWRRVSLTNQPTALDDYQGKKNDPAFLQSVLNAVLLAGEVLEGARTVIEAVHGDVDRLFEPVRQTRLLLKDAVGVATTLADLPGSIASQAENEAVAAMGLNQGSFPGVTANTRAQFDFAREERKLRALQSAKDKSKARQRASQLTKVFANASAHYELMNKLQVKDLKVNPAMRRKIQDEIDKVRRLTRLDFEKFRDSVQQFALEYADAVGEGSATYDLIYNRPTRATSKKATDTDHAVLFAMNQTVQELTRLAVTGPQASSPVLAVQAVAGLARRSGIAFTTPTSKFPVPLPYGATLEQIALRYLGDAQRWHEIVALNGLREPYIDEVGFELLLISNGHDNQVVVTSAANLFLGQPVTLTSTVTTPSRRRIFRIDPVTSTQVILTLDGDADLARYTTAGGAKLHAYLPDTANSQQQIYIPSPRTAPDELTTRAIPGVDTFSDIVRRGGVDLLLTTDGDAAVGPDGDWRLAIGLTNLVQRIRIAVGTARGSLPQHPSFGLGLQPGMSTADADANQLLEAAKGMFAGDPDFTGVRAVRVAKNGSTLRLNLEVGIAGQDLVLPVSFLGI